MKKKDIQELKHRNTGELHSFIKDSSEKLRAMQFDLAAGKVKDITEIRNLRKGIARAKTFLTANGLEKPANKK